MRLRMQLWAIGRDESRKVLGRTPRVDQPSQTPPSMQSVGIALTAAQPKPHRESQPKPQ